MHFQSVESLQVVRDLFWKRRAWVSGLWSFVVLDKGPTPHQQLEARRSGPQYITANFSWGPLVLAGAIC